MQCKDGLRADYKSEKQSQLERKVDSNLVAIGKRTRTRPNWARKVRKLDMGDRDGGHVKVVHQLERLRGLGLGKKWI